MSARAYLAVGLVLAGAPVVARAGSHTWQFNEVFSDASGQYQFIELVCYDDPNENFLSGLMVTTNNGSFTFPGHLSGSTEDRFLLLATASFATLPGAPTPDYIIPENFIPLNGGFIRYNPPGNYDTWNYGPGVIPTNGISTIQFTDWTPFTSNDPFVVSPTNSPTNYEGGTGTVNAACLDFDGDGYGDPGDPSCPNGSALDCDDANNAAHPGGLEQESANNCKDGADNDCDGATDCVDALCADAIPECVPTVSEWGMVALALLVLSAGSVMIKGRA